MNKSALIPVQAERQHVQLGQAVRDNEKYVPCLQIDEVDWYSDDEYERQQAVDWCKGCPVLKLCHQYAQTARESEGVWGAVDRSAPGVNRRRRPSREVA